MDDKLQLYNDLIAGYKKAYTSKSHKDAEAEIKKIWNDAKKHDNVKEAVRNHLQQ